MTTTATPTRTAPTTRVDTPVVRLADAARTYGSGPSATVAVHGASCEVLPGDRIALVGASGSGKSTLLHLMGGLDQPTAGTVAWPGIDGPLRPGPVGVVFQGPSLLAPLTVLENVALPGLLAGAPEIAARAQARAALDALDIGFLAESLPEELSGGQAQRVAVARVLSGRPRLVLADEPTGQLDRTTADHVMDLLLTTADATGAALVVATHDLAVAARLATRWTMADGRLSTTGGR